MSNNISKKIKELREQNNITQNKLANDLFIKQQTVAQWENGSRALKADSIISLAKYFNVSTDYLLGLTENTSTNISEIGISNKTGFCRELLQYRIKKAVELQALELTTRLRTPKSMMTTIQSRCICLIRLI